jgi:phage/plasmid-like protein (TIGR03299 family)
LEKENEMTRQQIFDIRHETRESVWRRVGTEFDDRPSVTEALTRTGNMFDVSLRPVHIDVLEEGIVRCQPVENRFAIVRDNPRCQVFGVVSDDYTPLQNVDIAKALDTLTDKYPVHACGSLNGGETTFVVLDAGEILVKGIDLIRHYLVARDRKNGGNSFQMVMTPIRMGCTNMLTSILHQAEISVRLLHGSNITRLLIDRVAAINQVQQVTELTKQLFDHLAEVPVTAEEFKAAMTELYPAPQAPDVVTRAYENSLDNHGVTMAALRELFGKFNEDQPWAANTRWGLYNAVTEYEDYRWGRGNVEVSVMWGGRAQAKQRVLEYVSRT